MIVDGVAAFQDNYIWLARVPSESRCLAVDPGQAGPVLDYLHRNGFTLGAILITHHHPDHTGGIATLLSHFDVPVYGPAREPIPHRNQPVSEGETVRTCGLEFSVMETPGHTLGHVVYSGQGVAFTGDTLFTAGCGRLFEGTPEQMLQSLKRIAALPDTTWVYCAHEYTLDNLRFAQIVEPDNPNIRARVGREQARRQRGEATVPAPLTVERDTNPFLRTHVPEVIQAAERHAGRSLSGEAEVFAVLRSWKDEVDSSL